MMMIIKIILVVIIGYIATIQHKENLLSKTKILGTTPDNNSRLDTEVVFPLKYLSNFWRSLDLSLINCKIAFDSP